MTRLTFLRKFQSLAPGFRSPLPMSLFTSVLSMNQSPVAANRCSPQMLPALARVPLPLKMARPRCATRELRLVAYLPSHFSPLPSPLR